MVTEPAAGGEVEAVEQPEIEPDDTRFNCCCTNFRKLTTADASAARVEGAPILCGSGSCVTGANWGDVAILNFSARSDSRRDTHQFMVAGELQIQLSIAALEISAHFAVVKRTKSPILRSAIATQRRLC
jgi:hypothetical protein